MAHNYELPLEGLTKRYLKVCLYNTKALCLLGNSARTLYQLCDSSYLWITYWLFWQQLQPPGRSSCSPLCLQAPPSSIRMDGMWKPCLWGPTSTSPCMLKLQTKPANVWLRGTKFPLHQWYKIHILYLLLVFLGVSLEAGLSMILFHPASAFSVLESIYFLLHMPSLLRTFQGGSCHQRW